MKTKWSVLVILLVWFGSSEAQAGPTSLNEFSHVVAEIQEKYNLPVVYKGKKFPIITKYNKIFAKSPTAKELEAYAPILQDFLIYPKQFIQSLKIDSIVLCSDLRFVSPKYNQKRSAVPLFEKRMLIYDVSKASKPKYARGVLHHEFFHHVDWVDDGLIYTDLDWTKTNEKSFVYGSGGADYYSKKKRPEKGVGFVSWYAKTGVAEDKAETFQFMVINADRLKELGKKDKVLKRKFKQMKKLLYNQSPDMNRKFWKELARTH